MAAPPTSRPSIGTACSSGCCRAAPQGLGIAAITRRESNESAVRHRRKSVGRSLVEVELVRIPLADRGGIFEAAGLGRCEGAAERRVALADLGAERREPCVPSPLSGSQVSSCGEATPLRRLEKRPSPANRKRRDEMVERRGRHLREALELLSRDPAFVALDHSERPASSKPSRGDTAS